MTVVSVRAPIPSGSEVAAGYVVCEHLNRGVTLDVYSVWSRDRDCLCVAKMLRPDRRDHDAALRRLMHEGWLLTHLDHPHLVRGYDVLDTEHGPVVISQTLPGQTLSRLIESEARGGLDHDDVAVLGRQLCSVLHYLHRHGTLHLDLKPSNVICSRGTAVLLDLSLARAPGRCSSGAGTTEYMAPEQVSGDWVDTPTDVWGLGGVLYRAVTGHRPFSKRRTHSDVPDLGLLDRPGADPRLTRTIRDCLRPASGDRPSLADVRYRLDAAIRETLTA